jgi:hypothetical protein
VRHAPAAILTLALALAACGGAETAPAPDRVERQVLDSGSLRRLAIAGAGRFAEAPLVADCLAPGLADAPPPCRHVKARRAPLLRVGPDGDLEITTGANAAVVSVLAGAPGSDELIYEDAHPATEADRRRWEVRLGGRPTPGSFLTIRVSPLRTDSGHSEFRVRVA